MKRTLAFTAGKRTVHIPLTLRIETQKRTIPFVLNLRRLRIPMFAELAGSRRILQMVVRDVPFYVPFVMILPERGEIVVMRIGDLDRLTIGTLDPFAIPDER